MSTKEPTIAVEIPSGVIEIKPSQMSNHQLAALLRCNPDGDGELQTAMWGELLRRLRTGEKGPGPASGLDDDKLAVVIELDERILGTSHDGGEFEHILRHPGVGVSAKTVGELRKVTRQSSRLVEARSLAVS
jgi:hypothetical protein